MPPQTAPTIGDRLSAKHIDWAWYAGAWDEALADGKQPAGKARRVIYAPQTPGGGPDFQPHHQPFNYYANFDPATAPRERAAHLKDFGSLITDIAAGRLPPVVFYKPQGNLNQHPGYASIADGDAHIADLVAKLRAGPQWNHMVIVITYDEYGGAWDHLAPPRGDLLGPGTRIPALIVSPFAQNGYGGSYAVRHRVDSAADHPPLRSRRPARNRLRDRALKEHGEPPMGDLTQALDLAAIARVHCGVRTASGSPGSKCAAA